MQIKVTVRKRSDIPSNGVLLQAASSSMASLLRAHFTEKGTKPNKLGGKRTKFWAMVARSTIAEKPEGRKVAVTIGDAKANSHFWGARNVKPGSGKEFLTIPIRKEAHGKRIGQLAIDLGGEAFFCTRKRDGMGFAGVSIKGDGRSKKGRKIKKRGGIFYVLKDSVDIPQDKTALPSEDELKKTAVNAMLSKFK